MLLRDAGNTYPKVTPINDLHSMKFSCIVDMPVEIGISEILKMKTYDAGGLTDYEEKAKVAAKAIVVGGIALGIALLLGACGNTISGVGKDISDVGAKVTAWQNSKEEVKNEVSK